jgi:hypothetical protein
MAAANMAAADTVIDDSEMLEEICKQERLTPDQMTLEILPTTGEGYSRSDYDDFLQSLTQHALHDERVDVVAQTIDAENSLITVSPYFSIQLQDGDTVEIRRTYVRFCIYNVDAARVQDDVARYNETLARHQMIREMK